MPRGGRREGSGRKPGIPQTKAAIPPRKYKLQIPSDGASRRELAEMAKVHAEEAIAGLLRVIRSGVNQQATVSACVALLDRGFGRPAQIVDVKRVSVAATMSDSEVLDTLNEFRRAHGLEPYPSHPFKVIEHQQPQPAQPRSAAGAAEPVDPLSARPDGVNERARTRPRSGLP